MTQAELLLLKLATGHGPFRRYGVARYNVWHLDTRAKCGDPILICMCHGWAFDTEKLIFCTRDYRANTSDLVLDT